MDQPAQGTSVPETTPVQTPPPAVQPYSPATSEEQAPSSNDAPPPPEQPTNAQPPQHNQHSYFVGALVGFFVLLVLGGAYGYFVFLKPKQVQVQQQSYQNPFTTNQEQVQQPQPTAYENPFTEPTQAYENPFGASGSSEVSDKEYQNPFRN